MTHPTSAERRVATHFPAKEAPLAGITVYRALPRRELRRVGPFVFLDHFGPFGHAAGAPDDGTPPADTVGAHPHAGLQTVTYLFSGAIDHRDSLGTVQRIHPGAANWMTAGAGIVHGEFPVAALGPRHGIQAWVALPPEQRGIAPAFEHVDAERLPHWQKDGATVRLLAGRLDEHEAPVHTYTPLTYADIALDGRTTLAVEPEHQLALYVAEGCITVAGPQGEPFSVPARTLVHLSDGGYRLPLASDAPARLMLLGGAPLPEPTVIWWNFITDSMASGKALQARWEAGGFPPLP
ncbi:putative pirin-like protein [Oryzomicrobium terrae]|uniref:Putative pirin-like protein n=1 Tax=Oryzomicrobium terrae TaxID=1735038 RepID=A0A5C1EC12_9RHOO|nr:pirin family protein [Oryzomicrobium terrae]QEL65677.1 putative pirin-like protein [Oryzomicrobium terrae]